MQIVKLLTVSEVAKYLNITRRTALRYIHEQKLKASKIGQYRVSSEDLLRFIKRTTVNKK